LPLPGIIIATRNLENVVRQWYSHRDMNSFFVKGRPVKAAPTLFQSVGAVACGSDHKREDLPRTIKKHTGNPTGEQYKKITREGISGDLFS
jgi:hypothetical protein